MFSFRFFRVYICFLLLVTFDTDCLSTDRLHIHCHAILLGLIFKLRLSGGLLIHLCGKREDLVVELVFSHGLMSCLGLPHTRTKWYQLNCPGLGGVSTPSNKRLIPKKDSWWKWEFPSTLLHNILISTVTAVLNLILQTKEVELFVQKRKSGVNQLCVEHFTLKIDTVFECWHFINIFSNHLRSLHTIHVCSLQCRNPSRSRHCRSHQFPSAIPSLRSNTGLEDELVESCGGDVEDESLPELVDNPGTTRGTKLSFLHMIVFPSLVNRDFWSLTHSQEYPWSSQSLPSDRTASVSSSNCTVTNRFRSWTKTCASSRVCTSPLAVSTTVGGLDLLKVSSSSELKSFLHSLCIDAPESTMNSRYSGRKCRHCLCFNKSFESSFARILELVNIFAKSHAALRAHPSWCKVSSCYLSSHFGAQGLRSWGAHIWIIPRDGPFLSRICDLVQGVLEN